MSDLFEHRSFLTKLSAASHIVAEKDESVFSRRWRRFNVSLRLWLLPKCILDQAHIVHDSTHSIELVITKWTPVAWKDCVAVSPKHVFHHRNWHKPFQGKKLSVVVCVQAFFYNQPYCLPWNCEVRPMVLQCGKWDPCRILFWWMHTLLLDATCPCMRVEIINPKTWWPWKQTSDESRNMLPLPLPALDENYLHRHSLLQPSAVSMAW
jgi:hypothetical protein